MRTIKGRCSVVSTSARGYNNAAEGDTFEEIENARGGLFDDYLIGSPDGGHGSTAVWVPTLLSGRRGRCVCVLACAGGSELFDHPNAHANVDTIIDFMSARQDRVIQLAFSGLGLGPPNPNAFVLGTQAEDADDRIIYDQATGNLYYDADGSGSGGPVLFAQSTA